MKVLAVALVVFTSASASAQAPVNPAGRWKGSIEIPGMPAEFEMDIEANPPGALTGTLTFGAEHMTLPLLKVEVDGRRLTIYARTDQVIRGELGTSGSTISGTAAISGYDLPFAMSRTGDAKIDPPPVNHPVSKELEGTQIALPLTLTRATVEGKR